MAEAIGDHSEVTFHVFAPRLQVEHLQGSEKDKLWPSLLLLVSGVIFAPFQACWTH
jgi:hypothetical protein